MKKSLLFFWTLLPLLLVAFFGYQFLSNLDIATGAPPYHVEDLPNPIVFDGEEVQYKNWQRPDGPPRVGLQVGHWKNDQIPEELERLRGNTGALGGGKSEWEVNYEIAMLTKKLLEKKGVVVDILPATVPQKYWADAFVSVHADGNPDQTKTGYKAATPRRDLSGKAQKLLELVEDSYQASTKMIKDDNITRNMKGHHAFSYWRYEHAVHPMTTSIILETGFLTTPKDRKIIVDKPELSAQGLANGLLNYLQSEKLLAQN